MGKKLTNTIELVGRMDPTVESMFKNVEKLAQQAQKALSKTELKDVEKLAKQSSVSASALGSKLRAVNDGLKLNPTSLDLITTKQRTLNQMIDTTKTRLFALKTEQAAFVESGGDLNSDQYTKLTTEIQKAENALERLNSQQNNFSPKVQQFGKRMEGVSEATGKVAKAIAPVSAGAGALGVSAIKTAADFDSAMNQIAATKGIKSTDAEMGQLREQAIKLGNDTAFTSAQAAEGLNILSMAGYKTGDAIAISADMLNLASAGQISMSDSATYLATTLKGFNMNAEDAGKIADRIAKGSSAAATDVGELGAAFADSAATSQSYGQTVDDVGVALLRLADQNVLGSAAGTSLAALEKNLYKASDQGKKTLDDLGVSAYDAAGKARPINDVVNEIRDSMQGLTDQEQSEKLSKIFDIQGSDAYYKMIATSAEKQKEFEQAMKESQDTAASMAQTQNEGLNGALTRLGSAFDNMKIKIGSVFTGPLEKGADFLTGLIQKFNDASDSTHKFAAYGLAGITAAAPALFGISKLTGGIGKFIDKAGRANTITGKLAGKMGGLFKGKTKSAGDGASMNPVSGMSSAVGSETSAAQGKIVGFVNSVGNLFKSIGTGISTAFQGIGKGISTALQGASAAISNLNPMGAASFAIVIGTLTLALIGLAKCRNDVLPFLQGLSDIFTSMVGGVLDAVASAIVKLAGVAVVLGQALAAAAPFVEAFGNAISTIAQGVGEGIASIAEGIGNGLAAVITAIGPIAPQLATAIATIVTAISEGAAQIGPVIAQIVTACQPIVSDLTSLLETALTQISPIIDSIGNCFKDLGTSIKTALEGVSGVIDSLGSAVSGVLDSIAGIIDSIGNAALNAGRGFDQMANGIKTITNLNIFDMGASLAAVATGAGLIAAHSGGIAEIGTGFTQIASAMQTLSTTTAQAVASFALLPGLLESLSSSTATISQLGPAFSSAAAQMSVALGMMSSAVSTHLSSISTRFMVTMPLIVTTTSTSMNQIANVTGSTLAGLAATVAAAMAGVVVAFQSAMASAVATVSAGMSAIRGMMSVSIQGPHLAVPHVSVSGNFSLNPPSAPSFSVSYYKEGGILSGATLFGMLGNTGLVGGEAGPEAVLPLNMLWSKLDEILTRSIGAISGYKANSSRLINNPEAASLIPASTGSGSIVVNFNPVINIGGEGGKTSEASISAALARAKDDLLDELEDILREQRERAYA